MDPVASGLTILNAIRKAVTTAKKLYDAPRELEELQVEVETFKSVLNDVILDTFESRTTSVGVNAAISRTQACLLEIQQLIEYELVTEVPNGKRARRGAWVRRVKDVHDLLERLGECRANVILAFAAGRSTTERRSEAVLRELQFSMQQKSEDIQRSLVQFRDDSSRNYDAFMERWDHYEQRWETHRANLESKQEEYQRLCQLLENLITNGGGPNYIEGPSYTAPTNKLLIEPSSSRPTSIDWHASDDPLESCELLSLSQFPCEQVESLLSQRAWIQTSDGQRRRVRPRLPTRVLDLNGQGPDIRLYESSPDECADYTALSYCWGGTASIVDSIASHGSRMERIPWQVLPRLFQDVITITRQLQIRYLWIDVLCIIQDDAGDWERETGKMGDVFGNATLTIAADSTPHPSSPLILPRLQIEGASTRESTVLHNSIARSDNPAYNTLTGDLFNSNWFSRAWIYQESLCSQAVVHFVAGKIIFEDAAGLRPLMPGIRQPQLELLPHPRNHLKALSVSLFSEPSLSSDILDLWWRVVEQYTIRKLTFQSDKLIAISGLAHRFAAALGPYAAGLWPQHSFVRSLCWQLRSTSMDSSAYVAPSWSWAALDGSIVAPTDKPVSICAEILKWECIPLGQNQLGAVKSAELTLKAPYVELEIRGQDNTHDETSGISQCLVYAHKDTMSLTFELDTFRTFHYGMKLACLKMLEDVDGDLTCMVLAPASNERWERVAVMQMQRRRGEHRWFGSAVEREFIVI